MSGRKKSGHVVRKELLSCEYEDISESTDSSEADPDWMDERKPTSSRKCWKRTQDHAEEPVPGQNRRNLGSKSGETSYSRRALGKTEAASAKMDESPQQCKWLQCINAARSGSKYCSDDCGVKLATCRILMVGQERVEEWNSTPCVATEHNKKELQELRVEIERQKKMFDELEENRQTLDKFIETVSQISYDSTKAPVEGGPGDDGSVYCVICGQETSAKSYAKHVDRCFIRTEKNIAFEDKTPSHSQIFCNFFTKKTGTYCKRLACNCPDHSKKISVPKNSICGSPLTGDLNLNEICRSLKKECARHFNWEKLRRADIDIQKITTMTKHEKLCLKEQEINRQISDRNGFLNLLLNRTTIESSNNKT